MSGPVLLQGDNKHNFDVIQKHLDTLKEVCFHILICNNITYLGVSANSNTVNDFQKLSTHPCQLLITSTSHQINN